MAEAIKGFTMIKSHLHHSVKSKNFYMNPFPKPIKQIASSKYLIEGIKSRRASPCKVNALPDWPLMAVLVQHMEFQRDLVTHKSIWHLSDESIKSIYAFYIMLTCWGCCFFGSVKDPYYDSEEYRKDGGDGTGHWVYDKVIFLLQNFLLSN